MLTTSPLTCALNTSSCRQRLELYDGKRQSVTGCSRRNAWHAAPSRASAYDDSPVQASGTRAGLPDMTDTDQRRRSRWRTNRPVPAASARRMAHPDLWPPLGQRIRHRREAPRTALHHLVFPLQEYGLRRPRTLYPCPWQGCGQQLRQHSALNVHIKRHMKERRFMCSRSACHQSFTTPCALIRHLKKNHKIPRGSKRRSLAVKHKTASSYHNTRQPQGSPPQTGRLHLPPAGHTPGIGYQPASWPVGAGCLPAAFTPIERPAQLPLSPYPHLIPLPAAWHQNGAPWLRMLDLFVGPLPPFGSQVAEL